MREWVFKQTDKALATELAKECEIPDFTAFLLVSKGLCDPFEIDEFLSDELVFVEITSLIPKLLATPIIMISSFLESGIP